MDEIDGKRLRISLYHEGVPCFMVHPHALISKKPHHIMILLTSLITSSYLSLLYLYK